MVMLPMSFTVVSNTSADSVTVRYTTSKHTKAPHTAMDVHLGEEKVRGAFSPSTMLLGTPVKLPSVSTMDTKS